MYFVISQISVPPLQLVQNASAGLEAKAHFPRTGIPALPTGIF